MTTRRGLLEMLAGGATIANAHSPVPPYAKDPWRLYYTQWWSTITDCVRGFSVPIRSYFSDPKQDSARYINADQAGKISEAIEFMAIAMSDIPYGKTPVRSRVDLNADGTKTLTCEITIAG